MVVPQKNMKILKRYTSKPVRTQIFTEKKKDWTSLEDNYVIVDPDEKYIETVSKLLKKNGYKVQVLNLKEPKKSVHYNPFVYEFNAMKIQHMVDALLENTKSKKDADFFYEAEKMLLSSIMAYVLEYGKEKKWNNMWDFINLVETLTVPEGKEGFLYLIEKTPEESIAKQYFDSFQNKVKGAKKSVILASVLDTMKLFTDDMLSCMEYDELCLSQWEEEKRAIFILFSQNERKNSVVVPLLLCQLSDFLENRKELLHG